MTSFKPKKRSGSTKDLLAYDAARSLREMIVRGELPPGSRLNQEALAAALHISRTPIREALFQLEREGLVERVGERGICVATIDRDELVELYEVRELVDGTAARLAAQRATTEEVESLDQILSDMKQAIDDYDVVGWTHKNIDFHARVLESAHNQRLIYLRPIIDLSGQLLYPEISRRPQHPLQAWTDHLAILDAIRRREPDLAETLARQHIVKAREMLRT